MFSLFLLCPLGLGLLVTVVYSKENLILEKFMSFSGYFLAVSNVILFFLVYRTFKLSDYKKDVVNNNYLEGKAPETLLAAITVVNQCLNKNKVNGLSNAVFEIDHINKSLKTNTSDAWLKAYSSTIQEIVNLIYKYSIDKMDSNEKLKEMNSDKKTKIQREIFLLIKDLGIMINHISEGDIK